MLSVLLLATRRQEPNAESARPQRFESESSAGGPPSARCVELCLAGWLPRLRRHTAREGKPRPFGPAKREGEGPRQGCLRQPPRHCSDEEGKATRCPSRANAPRRFANPRSLTRGCWRRARREPSFAPKSALRRGFRASARCSKKSRPSHTRSAGERVAQAPRGHCRERCRARDQGVFALGPALAV